MIKTTEDLQFLTACHNVHPIGEVTYVKHPYKAYSYLRFAGCPQCQRPDVAMVRWTHEVISSSIYDAFKGVN